MYTEIIINNIILEIFSYPHETKPETRILGFNRSNKKKKQGMNSEICIIVEPIIWCFRYEKGGFLFLLK